MSESLNGVAGMLPIAVPTATVLAALIGGRIARRRLLRPLSMVTVVAALIALAVITGVVLVDHRVPGVSVKQAVWATVLGGVAATVVPGALTYAAARYIKRAAVLVALGLASVIPAGTGAFVVAIGVAGGLDCPPGAYECPM